MTTDAGLPERIETVLLDAGGVLLDLDYAYLRRLIEARKLGARLDELPRAEAEARDEIHRQVQAGGRVSGAWRDYFHHILGRVGVPGDQHEPLIDSLWEAHQRFGLWNVSTEGGPETIAELKRRGFKLGVVSNAEGRVAQDLDAAGYRGMFETVIDSHRVGIEKPDPDIFRMALVALKADVETSVFLGDVPSVDVAGARSAGLTPILLDPHQRYEDWDVLRLRSIRELVDCVGSPPDGGS